jgi:glycerol-3-phosphate dehydrogenase
LLESAADVGTGTSKANTAILRTGFDATPGTLEARLVPRGYALLRAFAAEIGVPFAIPGGVLVAWSDDEAALQRIQQTAIDNGHVGSHRLTAAEVRAIEPDLGEGARGGLSIPDEGIVCPWTTTLAFATEAVLAGGYLALCAAVTDVELENEATPAADAARHTPRPLRRQRRRALLG